MTSELELLDTAIEATTLASKMIRTQSPGRLTAKGDRDYASELDFAVEREVRAFLARKTPSIGFLGEEEGGAESGVLWALDPIDGTVNFAHANPLCGVSLALVADKRPVVGVIQLPFLGSTYTAVRGRGAYRDGHRLHTSTVSKLRDAVVSIGDYAVGDGFDQKNTARLAVTSGLAHTALRVRMFGSAAVDLAWLAEGRTDASVTLSNNPWDTAAGVIIAREAGACVVDRAGMEHTLDSTATIAAPPGLLDELLRLVQASIMLTRASASMQP